MNKDERLEEMIAIIRLERIDCMSNLCKNCEYYAMNFCRSTKTATALYNAGYRKVADDEQIVNTEQLNETLNSTFESGRRMGYAQGRDETAREILKKVIDKIENLADREIKKGGDCEKYFDMVLDLLDEMEDEI